MLEQSQASLNHHVLQNGSRRDVNGAVLGCDDDDSTLENNTTTKVDITSNSQVIKLNNVGDGADSLLELSNLLEVTAQLDQRSRPESVGINDQLTMAESVEVRFDKHEI